MNFFSSVLFVSLSASSCFSEPTEETIWIDIDTDTLYTFGRSNATWDEASESCKLIGKNGRLASIDSYSMERSLQKYVAFSKRWLWIGIRKNGTGDFVRTGNARSSYTNWQTPKRTASRQDCVAIVPWSVKWNDANCTSKWYYLCAADRESMSSGKTAKDSHSRNEWTYGDTLYQLETESLSWHEAAGKCMTKGKNGRLATIDSESILNNIHDSVKYVWGATWIGIYKNSKGEFERVGSRQSSFFKWGVHEPNNANEGEDCVLLMTPFGDFNDGSCSIKHSYICAFDIDTETAPVTEPRSSFYTEPLTFTDIAKECHAVVIANSFFIVFVVVVFVVAFVLKRWPLSPEVHPLDKKSLIPFNEDVYN